MLLPNNKDAQVDPEKITEYLLSPLHPVGKSKATWFGMLGYDLADWRLLQADLTLQASGEAQLLLKTVSSTGQRNTDRNTVFQAL